MASKEAAIADGSIAEMKKVKSKAATRGRERKIS